MPDQRVIYITGRGGDANKGLGAYLKALDANRIGLSINGQFLKLSFDEQVTFVTKLIGDFDSSDTYIIANSYGAYLCLQALIDAPQYLSRFLLLSPVIGAALNSKQMAYSRLPSSQKYKQVVADKRLTKPHSIEVHIGSEDAGYDALAFDDLCVALGSNLVNVIDGQGHGLERNTVQAIVTQFLGKEAI